MEDDVCRVLQQVNLGVRRDGRRGMDRALWFLHTYRKAMLSAWGGCSWSYACPSDDPSVYWVGIMDTVVLALREALAMPPMTVLLHDPRIEMALLQWDMFMEEVRKSGGCSERPTRWVIRAHDNVPPFWGKTVCTPDAAPRAGETHYPDRAMCEYALYRSPPFSTQYQYSTQCSSKGCGQRTWGVKSSAVEAGPPNFLSPK